MGVVVGCVEVERSLGDVGSPVINLCLSPKKEVLSNLRLISISKTLYFARTGIMLPRDPRPSRRLIMLITQSSARNLHEALLIFLQTTLFCPPSQKFSHVARKKCNETMQTRVQGGVGVGSGESDD